VKQLVLDLIPAPVPSFENFVPGRNIEALNTLQDFFKGAASNPSTGAAFRADAPKVVYLWGVSGSGKTHLAVSFAARADTLLLRGGDLVDALGKLASGQGQRFVVDGVEALDDAGQVGLFNLINTLNEPANDGSVIVTGNAAPRDLALRPELSSRLGSGLVFQLHPLSDAEKAEALHAHAHARGFRLRDEVAAYLLRHSRRDMASLISFLDALDKYSLETGREITLPLLRDMSQPSLV
jgi:DnaA-homolog protein